MTRSRLPSLTALRAFDAAARNLNFSAAARELNVTHAAVAQQVRALEADLGLSLMYREGRGVQLTAEGTALAAAVGEAFDTVAVAVAGLSGPEADRPLRVTMTSSFAAQWLMPRLGAFWARHPDIPLSLHPDRRVVDMRREGMDLAIRFGRGDWPGVESELLTPINYVVVAAPSLVPGGRTLDIAEMAELPWVLETDWPEQLAWLSGIGLDPAGLKTTMLPEEMVGPAVRQGYGLGVEYAPLLAEDVSAGRVNVVCDCGGETGQGYHLVTLPGVKKPALKTFTDWLKSAV